MIFQFCFTFPLQDRTDFNCFIVLGVFSKPECFVTSLKWKKIKHLAFAKALRRERRKILSRKARLVKMRGKLVSKECSCMENEQLKADHSPLPDASSSTSIGSPSLAHLPVNEASVCCIVPDVSVASC